MATVHQQAGSFGCQRLTEYLEDLMAVGAGSLAGQEMVAIGRDQRD